MRNVSASSTSASASSTRCPGNANIRSRFTSSNSSTAAAAAARASAASCTRPSAARWRGVKLCTPTDSRLTPASRKPSKRRRSNVPGFASIVTSAPATSGSRARIAASRRSIASGENRLGVPPPRNTVDTLRPHTDGSARSRSATSASTYASSGGPASPPRHSCELKSQYGHFFRHHGRCTYSESGGSVRKVGADCAAGARMRAKVSPPASPRRAARAPCRARRAGTVATSARRRRGRRP